MGEIDESSELIFFDTFSHEEINDINLDLVQFPKPVYITQVRIIPLGARVQADFPGGVRLGATNPSKFDIEFFVNDLGLPGASTFENLGHLRYNQNDCIHLECSQEKIPTDGLVLRGWYSTITLAVYGILTNSVTEPIASPTMQCETAGPEEICNLSGEGINVPIQDDAIKDDWAENMPNELMSRKASNSDYDPDELEYTLQRDHYHQHVEGDQREPRRMRRSSRSIERSPSLRKRTHSENNEHEYMRSREKLTRDWSRSPEYPSTSRRSRRKRSDRSRSDAEDSHKWPRTPPASIDSPSRPETVDYDDDGAHYKMQKSHPYRQSSESLGVVLNEEEERSKTPNEQFELILSDDEIIGDEEDALDLAAAEELEKEIIAAAAAAPPAINHFDPWIQPLLRYDTDLHVNISKELENLRLLIKKFSSQAKCDPKIFYNMGEVTTDEREHFLNLGEQLINQLAYQDHEYKRRNFLLQQLFASDEHSRSKLGNILQISLDLQAACLQQQPTNKTRHMKVGAKIAESLCINSDFFTYLLNEHKFDVIEKLFSLYNEQYMSMPLKMLLLKALYAVVDSKSGLKHFLTPKINGYRRMVEALKTEKTTRMKFAVQPIVRKLNLFEALGAVQKYCSQLFETASDSTDEKPLSVFESIEFAFDLLIDALVANSLSYQQPRRLLPVSMKFEVTPDVAAQRSFGNSLQSCFVEQSVAESILMLLVHFGEIPFSTYLTVLDALQALLQSYVGLDYFVEDAFQTAQTIVSVLLSADENPALEEPEPEEVKDDNQEVSPVKSNESEEVKTGADSASTPTFSEPPTISSLKSTPEKPTECVVYGRFEKVGLELAYKVQTRYHLDAIVAILSSNDYDEMTITDHLHDLYSQTCNPIGRLYTVEYINMNNNMQIFMDLIKKEQRLQAQRQIGSPGAKNKSPVLSYAVDLVDCCVRYCEKLEYLIEHGSTILELAKNHDSFEPSVSAVLQEMYVYLKPLEAPNVFAYDDISSLVEVITRSLDYITTFPGDLIMGLRILKNLALGMPMCPLNKSPKPKSTFELKFKYVRLKFFSADGVQILTEIMEKLYNFYEQPGLHSPALTTIQGVHCIQILLPSLQILRSMLSFAIECRGSEFKDLTAIDHLMKVYFLLYYYPSRSQASADVELAKRELVQTLLAYTQPKEPDAELLHKSLWTLMIREVLRNIDGPSSFIPGLQLLAELLPLPLPMPLPIREELKKQQTQRLINDRKLWSAHLHPQSAEIANLIETLAPTSFPQLSELLQRVCMQLSDLAPNMTLLIAKTIIEMLCNEWQTSNSIPTAHLARLLHFSSRLCAFAPLKSSMLSILSGKFWDLFQSLLAQTDFSEVVCKCQLAVHRILESFLDSNISLISPKATEKQLLNLASALPPKELIPRIIDAVLGNLFNVEVTHSVSALAIRNLVILTEHDFTLYHLTQALKLKATEFQAWIEKVIVQNDSKNYSSTIESLILLLRSLTQIEVSPGPTSMPNRTLKLSAGELVQIINFQKPSSENRDKPHVLQRILDVLEKHKEVANEDALRDLRQLIVLLTAYEPTNGATSASEANADDEISASGSSNSNCGSLEPFLPQAEGLVTQYDARPIFTRFHATADDIKLTARYWLDPLPNEIIEVLDEPLYERIPCDLTEVVEACLTLDLNITGDCKRVLHLSSSPQSNRERTPTAPCFRTRRVEVEPSTGRPEKKMFISSGRGRTFSRPAPSRGDLFRSRPPNTSRPPSLHVDDFLALETCGAQPTGPTGYNKIPPMLRVSRVGRNRGSRISATTAFRQKKLLRTSSPSTWGENPSGLYRPSNPEAHYSTSDSPHYSGMSHFSRPRRALRSRPYMR